MSIDIWYLEKLQKNTNIMSKTTRWADFFKKSNCQLHNTYLAWKPTWTPTVPFPWWPPQNPGSWKPTWNPTWNPAWTPMEPLPSHTLKARKQHGSHHGPPWYLSHGPPIPWKLETNMEPNMEANISQHGTQHSPMVPLPSHTLKAAQDHLEPKSVT